MSDNMDDFWCGIYEELALEDEAREMNYRFNNKIWVTKDGKELKIKDMETSHIHNCMKMINKKSKEWGYAEKYKELFMEELTRRTFEKAFE